MERFRIAPDAAIYYCTYSVVDWLPVFVNATSCQVIANSLQFCHETKGLQLDSVVIMPTHVHFIAFDRDYDNARLESTLIDFRKFTGHQLVKFCRDRMPGCFTTAMAAAAGSDRDHRFWQPTRHPEAITSERFHAQKQDYLHDNPRRKGLVLDPTYWRWSSARWYTTGQASDCDVPITPVAW